MDLNLTVLCGRLAAQPEVKHFDSGQTATQFLLTVRTDVPRRRVDVIPVTMWDAPDEIRDAEVGARIWVAGSVQRRFWWTDVGRSSRVEIVAQEATVVRQDEEVTA